jgi:hypothetical protein
MASSTSVDCADKDKDLADLIPVESEDTFVTEEATTDRGGLPTLPLPTSTAVHQQFAAVKTAVHWLEEACRDINIATKA